MPRVADVPLHRIHIRLETEDYEWLKRELGDEKLISETIRKLIKNLRERREKLDGHFPPIEQLLDTGPDK